MFADISPVYADITYTGVFGKTNNSFFENTHLKNKKLLFVCPKTPDTGVFGQTNNSFLFFKSFRNDLRPCNTPENTHLTAVQAHWTATCCCKQEAVCLLRSVA